MGGPVGQLTGGTMAGNLLGMGSTPNAQTAQTSNAGLGALNNQNGAFSDNTGLNAMSALGAYSNGSDTAQGAMDQYANSIGGGGNAGEQMGFDNQLATGATTGTKFAEDQMGQNNTQAGLYGVNGVGGQLGDTENMINQEQSQGYNMQPQDQSLYGQEAGQISNQYAQQGNQAANSLASRGLSDSGAAGAQFSGIAGNQNQQLAQAQQQIAQQRFQNTQSQIAQNQAYAANLGSQYNSALQGQYGRQLAGAQNQTGNLESAAGANVSQNNSANQGNLAAANYDTSNAPKTLSDFGSAAMASAAGSAGKTGGQAAAASLFA